jgi:hypothetical protein
VINLLEVAYHFQDSGLRKVCVDFILENFGKISQSNGFKALDKKVIVDLLIEARQRM